MEEVQLPSDSLRELAGANGIANEFWDFSGNHRLVSAATMTAVLAALGVAANSEEEIAAALSDVELGPWRRVLPACAVIRSTSGGQVQVHAPSGQATSLRLEFEDGGSLELGRSGDDIETREVDGTSVDRLGFWLPANLAIGWHTLVATVADQTYSAPMALVPDAAPEPTRRGWGMMEQLYSVRSKRSWGIGDARDLSETASFFGDLGADFVLINPLHAASPVPPMAPSPYLPVTRRFVNPLYIRPEDVPELAYLPGPQRSLVEWAAEEVRELNSQNEPLDRDVIWAAKSQALEVIFRAPRSRSRQRDFERFRAREGRGLEDFALWCALREQQPEGELPDVNTVASQRIELAARIEYHSWLQWVVDEQLGGAQRAAKTAGMGIGIMQDLAVGVHSQGSDIWSSPEIFARTIEVGAPPDMYNQQGQNWSQPPWNPKALVESAYEPLRAVCSAVMRHSGAVRIDHILGFFRLWWIPKGHSAIDGTYVRYDHEAMLGVLLLEAHRNGTVVIGEDLGTVEPWVRDYLTSRGVLGTSVFWFEKEDGGYPLSPERYRSLLLATVNTHDLPPSAGYLAGEHVELRDRLGLLSDPVEHVRAEAAREREQAIERLSGMGLLGADPSEREIIEALHRYMARTPALLLGVALVDAVGERRAQNQPGTDQEYPNWRVPLADQNNRPILVEELPSSGRLLSLVAALRSELGDDDRLA